MSEHLRNAGGRRSRASGQYDHLFFVLLDSLVELDQDWASCHAEGCGLVGIRLIIIPLEIDRPLGGATAISNTFTLQAVKNRSGSMIRQSIRRRIVAIAVVLIILMMATSVLSMVMVGRVGHLLDELTAR
jgi:hypothetical protein